MEKPVLMLFDFSEGERVQLETMLGFLPDIRVIAVPKNAYSMKLEDVLAEKPAPALAMGGTLERKMLVAANASGQMLELLLSAVGQVTRGQKLLRAVLTDTNRGWTAAALCRHLIEEEAEIQKYLK